MPKKNPSAPAAPPPNSVPPLRTPRLDQLRGLAVVWMTVFHFCFDLQYFGFIHTDFYENPLWVWQRRLIVGIFVFCAGWGQALAVQSGLAWPRFFRRWRWLVLGAVLVSAGSYAVFPHSFIYFGILHGMALMLLLARAAGPGLQACVQHSNATARHGALAAGVLLGAAMVALPAAAVQLHAAWAGAEALNTPAWNWLGLISRKPVTEDYAPLFPWLGCMLWGLLWGLARPASAPAAVAGQAPRRVPALLAWLGRHSLPYYLIHQPLMFGLLALL